MPTWGFTKKALLSFSPERNLALFSSSLSPGAMLQRRKYSLHFPTKLDPSGNAVSSNAEVREHVYCCCRWRLNPKVNVQQQQKIPVTQRSGPKVTLAISREWPLTLSVCQFFLLTFWESIKCPPLLYLNNHATSFSSYRSYNSLQPSSCNILPHVIRTQLPSWSSKQQLAFEKEDERLWGFPGGSGSKESACNAGPPGQVPGLGRSPGEGNGNPRQYSYLENPTGRGA